MNLLNIQSLNPLNQLLILVGIIGFGFLLLVTYLDKSDNFALKRDWRDKEDI